MDSGCYDGMRNFNDAVNSPIGFSYQDIAKDFVHTGTITRYINHGQFSGYKLVGYGTNSLILRWILPYHRTFHIHLKKTLWTKWFSWIK